VSGSGVDWSAGVEGRCQGAECGDRIGQKAGVGMVVGEVEDARSGVAGEDGWDLVEAVPQPFDLPPAGLVVGEGEGLHPGGEVECELDDVDPDAVLVEGVQGQVA